MAGLTGSSDDDEMGTGGEESGKGVVVLGVVRRCRLLQLTGATTKPVGRGKLLLHRAP